MAIRANFKSPSGNVVPNVYVRLDRIWLSKSEGINAWVHICYNEVDPLPFHVFSVHADYKEGANPYTVLYKVVSEMSFFENVSHDHKQKVDVPKKDDTIKIEIPEEKKQSKKSKK